MQAEFSPVNCPCQMPSDEFKNHLRNLKYFLLKGNINSRSNLCNIQQSNLRESTTVICLAPYTGCGK